MIVEEIMKKVLHTLQPENTVHDAVRLMREENIRHIPITDSDNMVVGIITDHNLKNALSSGLYKDLNSAIYDTPIEQIMVKNPIVGHPLDFVEEVAATFYEAKISCLPIVSAKKLVGIVTTTDLLYTYIELTGAHQPGSKIDIRVNDLPGMLFEITKVFHENKANVLSVLVYPDGKNKNSRIVSVRLQVMNPLHIIEDLRKQGYEVLWPNLPGVTL